MPRLFTSTRPPPDSIASMHSDLKRKLPDVVDDEPDLELIDEQSVFVTQQSVAQPIVHSLEHSEQNQASVIKVPSVPKNLARLMDSHDLDNPYLVAAFNVLVANDNNPMRVPDILQAVQKHGWTQVLHRHKDRPEQLFGNALRAHQRRREFMNKPSLVFMVDAGGCWKHHELDLSAASGRRKGKIWCLSLDSGYACPYARLGLDLEWVMKAQHGPGGPQPARPSANPDEPSAKKRKVDVSDSTRFVPAPKLVPSRPTLSRPTVEANTLKSPQIMLQPPKVYNPASVLTQTAPRVGVTRATATAVPPSTPASKSAAVSARSAVRPVAEVAPVLSLLSGSALGSRKAALVAKPSKPLPPSPLKTSSTRSTPDFEPMEEDLPSPVPQALDDSSFTAAMLEMSAPFGVKDDYENELDYSASSDESMARTPTPPPAPTTLLTLDCNYDPQEMLLFGGNNNAQDVMMDDPAWSWLTQAGERNLDLLAAARANELGGFEDEFPPFEEFLDRRKMNVSMSKAATPDVPLVKVEDFEVDINSPLDFDAASLFDAPSGPSTRASSWVGRLTRESSVCSNAGSLCSVTTSLSAALSGSHPTYPTLQSSTTTTVPLFVATHSLTDDSIIVAESRSLPLKNGLAHQYVTVATPSTDEVTEFFGTAVEGGAANEEIRELEEELVDWDASASDESEPLSIEPPHSNLQLTEVASSPAVAFTALTAGL